MLPPEDNPYRRIARKPVKSGVVADAVENAFLNARFAAAPPPKTLVYSVTSLPLPLPSLTSTLL